MNNGSLSSRSRRLLRHSTTFLCCAVFAVAAIPSAPLAQAAEDTSGETDARVDALELAGALSNDGYKIRDGHWSGTFKAGDAPVLAVNLYAGNQYYFSLAATDKAKKVAVTVFDENGKLLAGELISRDNERPLAAAGVAPEASGPYYVRVQLLEGQPADFCLICTYK
ncbi:MAG: hypothetical protein JO295_11900 [Verrucomicrobia bacterium]|nr:hypothetical protein [Verrucomicrobiota bacterium]